MRLFIKLIFRLSILTAALAIGLIWYVQPTETLDLSYDEISIASKVKDMIKKRRFEWTLTEKEINDLMLKKIASRKQISENIEIKGARFELESNQMIAHVHLEYKQKLEIETTSYYSLEWRKPNIVATFLRTEIKDIRIPSSWIDAPSITVPIMKQLPPFIDVDGVFFEEEGVRIKLRLD